MNASQYIASALRASGKTQREVARDAGFSSSNIVSMLKTGKTKVPLGRIPALAKSLSISPQELFLLCLKEYEPELLAIIEQALPGARLSQADVDWFNRMKKVLAK